MNFKKIVVYQNKFLFDILDEIKEKFYFDVFQADKKNLEEIEKKLKIDFITLIKSDDKIEQKNQLVIKNFPIRINKLIELINLKFLKQKFNYQSDFSIGSYKLNLNSREISRDFKYISLTEREIDLIIFLKQKKTAVKIDELEKEVWDYGSELDTHTVETHIYRLRKKIKQKFGDENFIISSKEGYLIN